MLPSPSTSPARAALIDHTNVEHEPSPSPTRMSRKRSGLPTPTSARQVKRARVYSTGKGAEPAFARLRLFDDLQDIDLDSSSDEEGTVGQGPSTRPARTVFSMRAAAARGQRPTMTTTYLPTSSILSSFVSSHKSDVFKCFSEDDNFLTPPYACQFSHASKRGQESRLAVATEQGAVLILDVSARKDWDPEPPRSVLRPHRNGIFDVCWSPSDIRLATCSADHTAAICDPLRPDAAPLRYLHGHQGTLKCVAWHTDDILATGGRDGKIRVWDLRLQARQNGTLASVMTLSEKAQPVKKVKKARLGAAPSKSITGILFADGYDSAYSIISSTSTDGILRAWDVRKPRGAKSAWLGTNEPAFLSHEDPTTHGGVHRARGLSGITPGHGPTTGMLFALGADSQVHVYHAATLQPLSGTRMGLAHPGLKGTSFYARTALSPCGRWLATGSAGLGGNAFMFDVGGLGSMLAQGQDVRASVRAVHLQGHVGEVGAPDWADGGLATCADDGTVRMWRPDVEAYRRCQAEPQEAQWDWSWAKSEES